jgi:TonB-linked SusC/RagA family outer membrane protein
MKINRIRVPISNVAFLKLWKIMRLSVFIFVFFVAQSYATMTYSQLTNLSLNMQSVRVIDVLNMIEDESEFFFLFNQKLVDVERRINVDVENEKIDKILKQVFEGTNVSYLVKDRQIILTTDSEMSINEQGQKKTVKGKILDAAKRPMAGVTVYIKGTANGTISDSDGEYSIANVSDNDVVAFSFIGMKAIEVVVGKQTVINVTLEEESIGLEEIVTIGYGSRAKRDVTTAISTMGSSDIAKVVPSSPELLMQGQMSGVQVIGNQGNPNARPTVRIRGTNTFGIADPLYVVDGIPIKEWGAGIEGAVDQYTRGGINIMALIDPNDIESISVLKDASSAAIYGVRASNGVVLITTKKGKKEKTTVNYSQRFGIQNTQRKIELLNTQQYVDFTNALYATDPESDGSRSPLNEVFRPDNPNYLGNLSTYDWQDAVTNKNALTQDYSVNVSGGTDKVDYFVSLGYSNQEGIYIDNNMKRYNGSVKLNMQINDYFKVGFNYRLSSAEGRDMGWYIGSYHKTALTPVCQPIYDPAGINGYAHVVKGYDENGVWDSNVLYGSMTRYNMPGLFSLIHGGNSSLRNMGNAYIEVEPISGLKLKGSFNADYFDNTVKGGSQYIGSNFKYDGGDPAARGGKGSVGDYQLRSTKNLNIMSEFTANYIKSFGNHNIDLLFNAMSQKFMADYIDVGTDYVTSTNPNLINLGGEKQYTRAGGFRTPGALQGFLFRGGYNYANKYYIDLTVRRDGSARFAPEKRWGTFPAASAAWRISEENFMKKINWLNDLKIRAGWGQLGNQEVADMAYLSTISSAPTYAWGYNPVPRNPERDYTVGLGFTNSAAAVYGMANRNLQWERTTTLNLGFDSKLINCINLSVEYYNKLTDGILQKVSLPQSAGIISMPEGNVAQVRNSGIEINLTYEKSIGDFNFSVSGNLTTVNNKVEQLYGGIPMSDRGIEEGYSLFYIRGFQLDGMFQSDEEAQAWMENYEDVSYQSAKVRGGDFYFKDLRGAPNAEDIANGVNKYFSPSPDSIIDAYDQVFLGKSIPGFYYGLSINAEYKGIDFSVQFTGVGDIQKVNQIKSGYGMPYGEAINHTARVLDAWTPENKNTDVPRMIWQDPAGNGRFSDYFVEDASYFRLSNLQLGYTLPETVYTGLKNILRNARIYVGCSNLFTLTKFGGLDPEDEYNPAPLIVYTGLNVRF